MDSIRSELSTIQAKSAAVLATAKAAGREVTDAELAELQANAARAAELKAAIERAERSARNFDALGGSDEAGYGPDFGGSAKSGFVDFGAAGVKAIAGKAAKALVAGGSSGTAVGFDPRPVPIGDTGPAAGLMSFFRVTRRDTPSYRFLRQTVRTSNAAVVAPGGTKPTSVYTVAEVPNSLAVVAHLSEMVDRFVLEDNAELEQFLATELNTGVIRKAETDLITAVLGTSGVQTLATTAGFTPAKAFDALYEAQVLAGTAGYDPSLIVMHPVDYQRLRLAKDADNRYFGGDPFGSEGSQRLWNTPTFVAPGIAQGTALVLDTNTVGISTDRQGVRLDIDSATGFDKNQVRFRSEGRFAYDVSQPAGIVRVTFTA